MRPRQCSMRSRSVHVMPGRTTTRALIVSPHFSSGTPMTAASATAGCWNRQSSTSIEETFSPPVMITSFLRSEMAMNGPSWYPPSPVWKHPSTMALAVSSGWLQYPSKTLLARARGLGGLLGLVPVPLEDVVGARGHLALAVHRHADAHGGHARTGQPTGPL